MAPQVRRTPQVARRLPRTYESAELAAAVRRQAAPLLLGGNRDYRAVDGTIQTLQPTAHLGDSQLNRIKDSESGERAARTSELPTDLSTSVPKFVRYSADWINGTEREGTCMWPFSLFFNRKPARQTPHHYEVAHVALREFATNLPYRFLDIAVSREKQQFLTNVLNVVSSEHSNEGPAPFKARDIRMSAVFIGDYPAVLIEMPPAHFAPEAIMVCFVVCVSVKELRQPPPSPRTRYFTLERADPSFAGPSQTMLCEWNGEEHLNYGEGPEATREAFLQRLKALVG